MPWPESEKSLINHDTVFQIHCESHITKDHSNIDAIVNKNEIDNVGPLNLESNEPLSSVPDNTTMPQHTVKNKKELQKKKKFVDKCDS